MRDPLRVGKFVLGDVPLAFAASDFVLWGTHRESRWGHPPTLTPHAAPAYTYLNDSPKEATEEQIRGRRTRRGRNVSTSGHCSSR
jgi:hypothetical protein